MMKTTLSILSFALICTALIVPSTAVAAKKSGSAVAEYMRAQAELGKANAECIKAQAALLRAQTEANVARAKIQHTNEETRGLALDNELKTAKTFFEKRQLNNTSNSINASSRPSREDMIRYSKSSQKRPDNYEVDPARGKIFWPATLCDERFSKYRNQLDELFAHRKQTTASAGSNFNRQTQDVVKQMQNELRSSIHKMPPTEYIAARKFLDKVAFEARFMKQIPGVAASK